MFVYVSQTQILKFHITSRTYFYIKEKKMHYPNDFVSLYRFIYKMGRFIVLLLPGEMLKLPLLVSLPKLYMDN